MKKNELIKLLQEIEGDPEVYFWNGLVGDYMDIDPKFVCEELVKQSEEFIFTYLRHDYWQHAGNFDPISESVEQKLRSRAKKIFSEKEYGMINPFTKDEDMSKFYDAKTKPVVFVNTKERGKSSWDRNGTICY